MKSTLTMVLAVIFIVGLYLIFVESIYSKDFVFSIGGKDANLSIFDLVLIIVSILALLLLIVSVTAYERRKNTKMLVIAFAFLLFTLKGILGFFDNFFGGTYSSIPIIENVLDLFILISFIFVLFRK